MVWDIIHQYSWKKLMISNWVYLWIIYFWLPLRFFHNVCMYIIIYFPCMARLQMRTVSYNYLACYTSLFLILFSLNINLSGVIKQRGYFLCVVHWWKISFNSKQPNCTPVSNTPTSPNMGDNSNGSVFYASNVQHLVEKYCIDCVHMANYGIDN